MSSCTSDDPDNGRPGKGPELSFDVSGLTRASVTTSFSNFAVYGDMKFPVDGSTVPTVIFDKTEVSYNNGAWSYQGVQYWFPKHEHSFVAVHPLSVLAAGNDPRYSDSRLSFTYTIPTSGAGKEISGDVTDIIAATHRRLYNLTDPVTTTTFKFGHIMSKINLAPALDDNVMEAEEYVKLHKMELSGFKTRATFNIVPAQRQSNSQTDDWVIDVTGQEADGKLSIVFAEPVKLVNDRKNVSLFDDNDPIIMLPQAFAAGSDAKIILSYTVNEDPAMKQITLPLTGKKWDSGKSYTYRFTFDRKGAHFEDTAISDWDMQEVGNVNAH